MKYTTPALLVVLIALGAEARPSAAASAETLLKKGVAAEQEKDGLDAAMKIYRQIVDEAEANRRHVAEAYLRLGNCHLKKGDAKAARAAFQKVITRFPDQAAQTARARRRLGELAPAGGVPMVVSTTPGVFANDVSPSLRKLTVTFDQTMLDKHWSWVRRYNDKYPRTTGSPSFDKALRTCSLPVKLEPGRVYWVEFNLPPYTSFRSADGVIAVRYALVFATKDAAGKATKIPRDLISLARKVNAGASGAAAEDIKAAIAAADKWLALADRAKHAESWDSAAAYFKAAVTREKWAASLKVARAPLGKLKARKLLSARYTTRLPGVPDGRYVVIQYRTSFEKKAEAVETVTPMKDKDGEWRVSGYYIKCQVM